MISQKEAVFSKYFPESRQKLYISANFGRFYRIYEFFGTQKTPFFRMVTRMECIINALGIARHVAVLTYGSAGDHFLVGNSDTDFSLLDDGSVSKEVLFELQRLIFEEFEQNPCYVSFKAWERVKVNPMDLLSVRFICGDRELFENRILSAISAEADQNVLITTLAGNDLHMDFMASYYFSGF